MNSTNPSDVSSRLSTFLKQLISQKLKRFEPVIQNLQHNPNVTVKLCYVCDGRYVLTIYHHDVKHTTDTDYPSFDDLYQAFTNYLTH